jgi:hypothetical protein
MDRFRPLYFEGVGCADIGPPDMKYGGDTTPEDLGALHRVVTFFGKTYILEEITDQVVVSCVQDTSGYHPSVANLFPDLIRQ